MVACTDRKSTPVQPPPFEGKELALPPGFIVPVTPESPPDVSPQPCAERSGDYLAWGDDLCGELRI